MRFLCFVLIIAFFTSPLHANNFDEHPKELTKTEMNNLVAFAKLYGYVRFFHPSNQALKTDWDYFAVKGIKEIEQAKDSVELFSILQKLFSLVAPSMKMDWIKNSSVMFANYNKEIANEKTGKIRYWKYKGNTQTAPWWFKAINLYRSGTKTVKVKDLANQKYTIHDPTKPFTAQINKDISIIMPPSVYLKAGKSIPHSDFKKDQKPKGKFSTNDRSTRMAIVISSWNLLKFFYPYWDVVGTDWNQSLVNALQKCAADTSKKNFQETMDILIAGLHDNHAISGSTERTKERTAYGKLPLTADWVENEPVITGCTNCDSLGIKPGDIIQSINGKHMWEYLSEKEKRTSGASDAAVKKAIMLFLFNGPLDSTVTLKLMDVNGKIYEKTLSREKGVNLPLIPHEKIKELEPGIYYLNFDKITNKDFKKALPELQKAKGIIFDMRTYPRIGSDFLRHLSSKPMKSARWMAPILTFPETIHTQHDTSGRWNLKPKEPYLSCPKVFIANRVVVSYAESLMEFVEAYKLGEIVGTPTAGTNGNINYSRFLGIYGVLYTGLKVLKNDGSQHHGIGILPTVPCEPTIRGIQEGRDEQLDKAIEVLKTKIK
jgi:hypothetical protein